MRTGTYEVCEHLAVDCGDDGSAGHVQDDVVASRTVAVPTLPRLATCRPTIRTMVELKKRGYLRIHTCNDVATSPTVATIGAAQGLELLTQN